MKYLWVIIAIVLVMPTAAKSDPELGVAVKGGIDAAKTATNISANRYGFTGGVAGDLQWVLTDRFSLGGQIALLYSPRGPKVVSEGEYLGQFRLHYFDVMVAIRPGVRLGPLNVYLLLGGGLDLLLSANKENASGAKENITDDLRRYDVALLAGAGAAFHLPSGGTGPLRLGTVFLEARYDHGLLYADAVNDGLKNRTSSLMLGLSFTLSSEKAASSPLPSSSPPSGSPSAAAMLSPNASW